ncbi:hypothetical protein AAG906_004247 [Vitis piasezkii]
MRLRDSNSLMSKENFVTFVTEDHETTCWGCGLRLLLASYTPIYKCGWCGAITNPNTCKRESKCFQLRRLRDQSFVCILIVFMLFLISFCCAGTPPNMTWGSYPVVGKGSLENYTFCHYCSKPKSPRTHHCRSCGMCILDMDHHCPFVTANHRHFIAFLISAVISTTYVAIMSVYAGFHIWPPLTYRSLGRLNGSGADSGFIAMKEIIIAFFSSAVHLSLRGLVLVYLFVSSVSVEIGLSVLLWQQLSFIYEGKTYLTQSAVHLSLPGLVLVYLFVSSVSVEIGLGVLLWQQLSFIYEAKTYLTHLSSRGDDAAGDRDCRNLLHFFGCPYSASRYLTSFSNSMKRRRK